MNNNIKIVYDPAQRSLIIFNLCYHAFSQIHFPVLLVTPVYFKPLTRLALALTCEAYFKTMLNLSTTLGYFLEELICIWVK